MSKDYRAFTRLEPQDKAKLDSIVEALPGNQSDHIRQAIREYTARILPTLAPPPVADPAAADPAGEITLREAGQ